MGIKIIAPAVTEPLTLDEVRLHLRLDAYDSPAAHPDDPLIENLISVGREWCENFTGLSLALQTIEMTLDAFPCARYIEIATPKVYAVQFVRYFDENDVEQTLSTWTLNDYEVLPRIELNVDAEWPATKAKVNAVRIRFQAGYTGVAESPSGELLPKSIRQAMLLVIGHFYEQRENSTPGQLQDIPMGAEALLRPYRLYRNL